MGYWEAGFEVFGVDIEPQPHYPFQFIQMDALDALRDGLSGFDVIHASPPCHAYSTVSGRAKKGERAEYPELVEPVRDLLKAWGGMYVIENVVGAPLENPIRLCGSSFGLRVQRHRLFESNVNLHPAPACDHDWQKPRYRSLDSRRGGKKAGVVGVHGNLNYPGEGDLRMVAMGIDWMTQKELAQAIPPAYTRWVGRRLLREFGQRDLFNAEARRDGK